ncbi:MAG: oligosaccharide repeat unit polymerase [Gemmatimonadota bacterium]
MTAISEATAQAGRQASRMVLVGGLLALLALALISNENTAIVAYPVAAVIVTMILFSLALIRLNGDLPYFETGFFFTVLVTIYSIYGPIAGIIGDLRYTPLNDLRLWLMKPTGEEIARIAWLHAALLASFATAYVLVRRRVPRIEQGIERPDASTLIILIALYIAIKIFFLFLVAFFGLRFETYADEFRVVRSLPLIFMQLNNHLGGMLNSVQLLILLSLFANYEKYKRVIFVWLGTSTVLAVAHFGSRTELFLLLLSAVIAYHRLVKPLSGRIVVAIGIAMLSAFLILGVIRLLQSATVDEASTTSEFDALFTTAVDLARRNDYHTNLPPPPTRLYNDVLALIPQQLIPIQKGDMAVWYLKSYHEDVYEEGGGYAFGIVAEAVVGYGLIELVIRGMLLGAMMAAFHRWYARTRHTVWTLGLYTWVTAISYLSYRNTTFTPIVILFFRFLPLYLIVRFFAPLLRSSLYRKRLPQAPATTATA